MARPLTRDQSREVDRIAIDDCGMSGLVLMENAARGCADLIREFWPAAGLPSAAPSADATEDARSSVVIICGKGNNGGDGFAIARHLDNDGRHVRVVQVFPADTLSSDAAANFRLLRWTNVDVSPLKSDPTVDEISAALGQPAVIIDAILGTGVTGSPRPPLDRVIAAVNACKCPVLAVDVPSGLDCDTGRPEGVCIRADATATFVAEKIGFHGDAAASLGTVRVIDIGVPRGVLRRVGAA